MYGSNEGHRWEFLALSKTKFEFKDKIIKFELFKFTIATDKLKIESLKKQTSKV